MVSYINSISYYLPERILSNANINEEHPEWSADKISSKTGIFSRHIAANDEFASDMGIKAAKKLFEESGINPKDIDFLLYCTQSPDYYLPTTACLIHKELNLKPSAGALDFNLGCSGFIYGLSLANGLVISQAAKKVLLITSETYTKHIHPNDKSNKTIFGDAAAATLISTDNNGFKISEFVFGTDGAGAENLMIKMGGVKYKSQYSEDVLDAEGNFVKNDSFLYMNGGEIFSFTSQAVPMLVNDLLIKSNISLHQIDYFVFHQANKFMLDFIRKKIGIDSSKFLYYLENVGNTVSSTIPIALKEQVFNKQKTGKILLAGFGVGYSWAGVIIDNE